MTPIYEMHGGKRNLHSAVADIREGLERSDLWLELVRRDIYKRTKGATLGRLWIIIAQVIAIAAMGMLYARLFGFTLGAYLPYLAVGLITWSFIIGLINEASEVFVSHKGYMTQMRFPLSVCLFRLVSRNLVLFAYKSLIIFAVLVILQVPVSWVSLVSLVGVAFISIAGFLTGAILGMLNARYRDIGQFVSSVTVLMFFLTPIFWKPGRRLGDFSWIVDYNPLYHFLNLVRAPLIGDPLTWWSFAMTGGVIVMLLIAASSVYRSLGHELIYWL